MLFLIAVLFLAVAYHFTCVMMRYSSLFLQLSAI